MTPNLAPGVNAPTLAAKAAHDAVTSAEADLRPVPCPWPHLSVGEALAVVAVCTAHGPNHDRFRAILARLQEWANNATQNEPTTTESKDAEW